MNKIFHLLIFTILFCYSNGYPKDSLDRTTFLPHHNSNKQINNILEQNTKDLSILLLEANNTQKNLGKFLSFVSDNFAGSRIVVPKIKGLNTINMLLKNRWQGDPSKITDYSRATISFNSLYEVYAALNFIEKTGLVILRVKDNFANPTKEGYRDLNLVFLDSSNQHLAEIQLTTHALLLFKNNTGHKYFDKIRNIQATAILQQRNFTIIEKIKIFVLKTVSKIGYKISLLQSI